MFNINFANDWIRTADLWYRKRPLYNCATPLPIFFRFPPKKVLQHWLPFRHFFERKMSQKKKSEFELLRHLCNLETELQRGRGRSSRQFTIDSVDLSKKLELKWVSPVHKMHSKVKNVIWPSHFRQIARTQFWRWKNKTANCQKISYLGSCHN